MLTLSSPAKLNLFLHITGRLANGYHALQTVFQLIDYADQLTFERRNDNECHLHTDQPLLATENNLILRACRLLQKASNCNQGVNITLHKRIPIGGGLGGGSSNAATTLIALNHLWNTQLTLLELAKLGLELGADVPIFIHGRSAWAEGIGEIIQPINLPEVWYLILVPPISVSTKEIFSAPELMRTTQPITLQKFLDDGGINDCEPVVRKKYPVIANALEWLNQFANAQLTGTGSCIFAKFETERDAQKVASKIPFPYSGFVAKGINNSPLHLTLDNIC